MPNQILAHPMSDAPPHLREFQPATPEGQRVFAETKAERAEIAAEQGGAIDADGRIIPPRLRVVLMPVRSQGAPLAERLTCAEAVDRAVEQFGLESVIRCLRLVAAINGRDL